MLTPDESALKVSTGQPIAITDSGGIEIYDVGSDVRATADLGGIHLTHINGSAFAHVDSGGIDATEVAGSIDAKADSGGSRVGQTRPAPIRARADSGGVTVQLASTGGCDISAESGRFFDDYAARAGFEILSGVAPRGLVKDLTAVLGGARVDPAVSAFYERTSEFQMDCWSEWSSVFRPFGRLLALVFSRRLEQLNVPLGGLDTHRGISSRVLVMQAPQGELQTAWVRQLLASKRTLVCGKL